MERAARGFEAGDVVREVRCLREGGHHANFVSVDSSEFKVV